MKLRAIITTIVLAALIVTTYVFSVFYGEGGRGFFSPDTFQVRTQSEILLPLLGIPIYRSSYEYHNESYKLVDYLADEGYWSPIETNDPSWYPMFHWNEQWRDGESGIYRYMNRYHDDWIDWTEENPTLAAVVWPKVLSILRRGITGGCAEHLMFLGRQSQSVEEFREYVNADPELQAEGIKIE